MSKEQTIGEVNHSPVSRLVFIDMARTIAILMMLQGHFITLSYKNYFYYLEKLRKVGHSGNLIFDYWVKIRGFTAPLFFTITGLVFVFLLTKNGHSGDNPRIKKGYTRGFKLILWGYLLQLNLKYITYYLQGHINQEFFAFHILQCIGVGILMLVLFYSLSIKFKFNSPTALYIIGGISLFSLYPILDTLPKGQYFPSNGPEFIQNMFHGPNENFPIIPWLGYVCFGGAIGSLIPKYQHYIQKKLFPLYLVIVSFIIVSLGRISGKIIDNTFYNGVDTFGRRFWHYDRLGEVLILLAFLILIERIFKPKPNLFLNMGQNTFPIYINHVIILYGAIFGISLRPLIEQQFDGNYAVMGAVLFIIFYAYYIKYFHQIKQKINFLIKNIPLKFANAFKK